MASDVLYVKSLAAPYTVNTMPEKTLFALRRPWPHHRHAPAGRRGVARSVLESFAQAGVDVDAVGDDLQRKVLAAFTQSWNDLVTCLAEKSTTLGPTSAVVSAAFLRTDRPLRHHKQIIADPALGMLKLSTNVVRRPSAFTVTWKCFVNVCGGLTHHVSVF